MKFTIIFALAVCLVCVNAVMVPYPSEDSSVELDDMTDGFVEVEEFGFLGGVKKALKIALRSVKGFNCVIKWVVGIQDSATQFNANVAHCGATASNEVTNLINANLKIISTCNDIINLKSNVCNDADDEQTKISNSCFVKTLRKMWTLSKQIRTAIKLAKKIPQTGPNAVDCVNDAVSTLVTYYTAFPQNMVTCSQLTS
ncbi:uncharacterized protein LOC108097901 [Drosophila ficusphila]|uniref:uncharacterized protein LOC108097901 n=1 Tax=Drosophila ficusphila TaxID=30025 RepID=UPI0007E5C679|nr:uncharacterized protein LOC108097901 [Drosophila ficusphila]